MSLHERQAKREKKEKKKKQIKKKDGMSGSHISSNDNTSSTHG